MGRSDRPSRSADHSTRSGRAWRGGVRRLCVTRVARSIRKLDPASQAALALGLALCLLVLGALAVGHGHAENGDDACDCALCGWLSHAAPVIAVAAAVLLALPVTGVAELRQPLLRSRVPGCPIPPRGPPLA